MNKISTIKAFREWMVLALPGDRITYHVGSLAADRMRAGYNNAMGNRVFVEEFIPAIHNLARAVFMAGVRGEVALVQRRVLPEIPAPNGGSLSHGAFAYEAVKLSGVPAGSLAREVKNGFQRIARDNAYLGV